MERPYRVLRGIFPKFATGLNNMTKIKTLFIFLKSFYFERVRAGYFKDAKRALYLNFCKAINTLIEIMLKINNTRLS